MTLGRHNLHKVKPFYYLFYTRLSVTLPNQAHHLSYHHEIQRGFLHHQDKSWDSTLSLDTQALQTLKTRRTHRDTSLRLNSLDDQDKSIQSQHTILWKLLGSFNPTNLHNSPIRSTPLCIRTFWLAISDQLYPALKQPHWPIWFDCSIPLNRFENYGITSPSLNLTNWLV